MICRMLSLSLFGFIKGKHTIFSDNEHAFIYPCPTLRTCCKLASVQIFVIKIVKHEIYRRPDEIHKFVAAVRAFHDDVFYGGCHSFHSHSHTTSTFLTGCIGTVLIQISHITIWVTSYTVCKNRLWKYCKLLCQISLNY